MKLNITIIACVFVPLVAYNVTIPSNRQMVEGKSLQFFREKGFDFIVDDSMAHHYEKPTVEISILMPERFLDADLTNNFESVSFLSEEVSLGVNSHPYHGKRRIILTLSEAVAKLSRLNVAYANRARGPDHASIYVLQLGELLDEWKALKKKRRDQKR